MKGWRLWAAMLFAVLCTACEGCDCGDNCNPTGPTQVVTGPTPVPPTAPSHAYARYFACRNPASQSPTAPPCAENVRLQLVDGGSTEISVRRGEKIDYDFWVSHAGDPNWLIFYMVDAFTVNPQTEIASPQFARSPETPPSPKRLIGKQLFVANNAQVGEIRKIVFQAYNTEFTRNERLGFVDFAIFVKIVQ
jgi:hypothetical protein